MGGAVAVVEQLDLGVAVVVAHALAVVGHGVQVAVVLAARAEGGDAHGVVGEGLAGVEEVGVGGHGVLGVMLLSKESSAKNRPSPELSGEAGWDAFRFRGPLIYDMVLRVFLRCQWIPNDIRS